MGGAVSLGLLVISELCGSLWNGRRVRPHVCVGGNPEHGVISAILSWCWAVRWLVKELRDVFVYHAKGCVR